MAELEVIDRLWIELPDSVTIHGDTAKPNLYTDEKDRAEFLEYVCSGDDGIDYEIRVYVELEDGEVYINALKDGEIVKEDFANPLTEYCGKIVRRFEKEFNEGDDYESE